MLSYTVNGEFVCRVWFGFQGYILDKLIFFLSMGSHEQTASEFRHPKDRTLKVGLCEQSFYFQAIEAVNTAAIDAFLGEQFLGKQSLPLITIKVGSNVTFIALKRALIKVINLEGGFFLIQDLYNLRRAENTEREGHGPYLAHTTLSVCKRAATAF